MCNKKIDKEKLFQYLDEKEEEVEQKASYSCPACLKKFDGNY